MLRFKFIFFVLLISVQQLTGQEQYLVSGNVIDEQTKQPLISATIQVSPGNIGLVCDDHGHFKITLPKGDYCLVINYLGYKRLVDSLSLESDVIKNYALTASLIDIQGIDVSARSKVQNIQSNQMSSVTLSQKEIKQLPSAFGEADVLKAIRLTPGIQAGGEGNQGLFVRGGDAGQNLVLLDQIPVYNPTHMMGFFSVFNADAVQNIELMKGGMPANYGGRASSVVIVDMKEGNPDKLVGCGNLGMISANLTMEGPFAKGRGTFLLSGRRIFVGLLRNVVKQFNASPDNFFTNNQYYFYDVNNKLTYKMSTKDKLYLSLYLGNDNYQMKRPNYQLTNKLAWGNSIASLRWNHVFNESFYCNNTVGYTNYHFLMDATFNKYQFKLSSKITDWHYNIEFASVKWLNHMVKYGINYTHHLVSPNNINALLNQVSFNTAPSYYSHESTIFLSDEWRATEKLAIVAGLRFTNFIHTGPFVYYQFDASGFVADSNVYTRHKPIQTFNRLEPRLSAIYLINDVSSLKGSFTINQQFIHLASVGSVSIPSDFWIPSTKAIQPQKAIQYTLGYFRNFQDNIWESSVEVYYKRLYNQIEFRNSFFNNINNNSIEQNITAGDGYAFGAEFYIKKQIGRTTGSLSYSLSRTLRKFSEINNGKIYPAKYDRIHDLSLTLVHRFNEKWTASVIFIFSTGNAMSLPTGRYMIQGNLVNDYSKVNSFRMPAYHRLDLSVTYEIYRKKSLRSALNFSVYNAYNRANPYYIYFEAQGNIDDYNLTVKPQQITLFPIIPALTWNINF